MAYAVKTDKVPEIIQKYEKIWSIKVMPQFPVIYNYVAPAILKDAKAVVFKIGLQRKEEFLSEYEALRFFNGQGAVRILNANVNDCVMLLEKAEPGVPVSEIEDDNATRAIISVMKKLWKPIPASHNFVTLKDWFKGFERLRKLFNGTTGPLPEKIVLEAEELYRYLIDTSTEQFLLHGDLHHDNVLSATREPWLAIDPDGVIGERAHEAAAMLRNPREKLKSHPDLKNLLSRRINILSEELEIDKERIKQCGVAQNVMSAIWTIEDGGKDWDHALNIAKTISELKLQ